jgi:hypothetical protein
MPELHPLISGLFIAVVTLFMPNGVLSLIRKESWHPSMRRWLPFRLSAVDSRVPPQ